MGFVHLAGKDEVALGLVQPMHGLVYGFRSPCLEGRGCSWAKYHVGVTTGQWRLAGRV
jgi:hypothetical protein